MAGLTSLKPDATYKSLLRADDNTNGIDAALEWVTDGEGTKTALKVAGEKIEIIPSTTDSATMCLFSQQDGTTIMAINSTTPSVDITGRLNVDNLRMAGNTLSSTNTNGDILLGPVGKGSIIEFSSEKRYVKRKTLFKQNIGANPEELFIDGSSGVLTIPGGEMWAFTVTFIVSQEDGYNAEMYKRMGVIKNDAGSVALVGSIQVIGTDTGATFDVAVGANDADNSLQLKASGTANITANAYALVEILSADSNQDLGGGE